MSTRHSLAAAGFLKDREKAGWHDKTLWMVREKRDRMSRELPEWEQLRDAACALKMYSNSHLAELLEQFEENASRNGAIVHWASDAREYRETVLNILQDHGARLFIKSKSMLAEECELTPYLEENGIETVESDLGERIVQLMHVKPSHIVLPAVHIRREEIGKLFEKEMGTEPGNSDPTYLTHAARKNLRQIFKKADAAMTGGNIRTGKDSSGPGLPRGVHTSACTLRDRTAGHHIHHPLLQAAGGRGIPYNNCGQRQKQDPCRERTFKDSELPALRGMHEHVPGVQAQRRIFVHVLHSRADRDQPFHAEEPGEVS